MGTQLKDQNFFRTGKIVHGGRSISWEKGDQVICDFCMDAARYFWDDESKEWEGYDDTIDLSERIRIAESKKIAS
jgi:hypothetical protein